MDCSKDIRSGKNFKKKKKFIEALNNIGINEKEIIKIMSDSTIIRLLENWKYNNLIKKV